MIRTNNFQPVLYPKDRHNYQGKAAFVAKRGMVVSRKSGATDEFELSTDKAGFFLTRDIVTAADAKAFHEANLLRPDKGGFQSPFQENGVAQCEDYVEFWVEGADLLHASLDVATPVGCPVTTAAGKLTENTDLTTKETLCTVVLNEAAKNGAGRRFLMRVNRANKAANAA